MTIRDRKVAVEKKVLDVLARSTAVIRADSVEGCTGEGKPRVKVGKKYAECDVEVVADALETEIDAVAEQGAILVPYRCAPVLRGLLLIRAFPNRSLFVH